MTMKRVEIELKGRLNITSVPADIERGVLEVAARFRVAGGKTGAALLIMEEGLKALNGKTTITLHARTA